MYEPCTYYSWKLTELLKVGIRFSFQDLGRVISKSRQVTRNKHIKRTLMDRR